MAKRAKTVNLAAVTAASVKAVVGRGKLPRPGILVGLLVDRDLLDSLDTKPDALARGIAREASAAAGLRLRPGIVRGPGGILVGFYPPTLRLR
jgi:hypothetical protein